MQMDLYTFYDWITSLLRPRGRFKSIEDQQQQEADATASTNESQQKPLESTLPSVKRVELIPTLNFVIKQPLATTLDLQHVASSCDWHCVDNDDDNNSSHTYIIETTPNTDELLQQEANFSLTDSHSSFVDEPTSSISIEMDNFVKSSTTATTATTSTDGVPASRTATTTTNRHSSRSAMTTITTPSSDLSIEEEIEEAIEISEDHDGDNGLVDANSLELSEAAGYAKTAEDMASKKCRQLFGIGSDDSKSLSGDHKSLSKKASSNDDQFKIDDDQLSGGKLAQHFVLEDDDDDDDFDVSLPMEKRAVHSLHDSSELEGGEQPKEESLSNQSTADDVSELVDEPRQVGEQEPSTSAEIELSLSLAPLAKNSSLPAEETSGHHKSEQQSRHSLEANSSTHSNKQTPKAVTTLLGASPEHSEKDHSIEELVETNHSIEMTFDDKDLSSLNPSFDIHNESMVNRLLDLTPVNLVEPTTTKSNAILEEEEHVVVKSVGNLAALKVITDLDEAITHPHDTIHKVNTEVQIEAAETLTTSTAQLKSIESIAINEAKLFDNKTLKVLETIQLQPVQPKIPKDIILVEEPRESRGNISKASSHTIEREMQRRQNANAGIDDEDAEDNEDSSLKLMKLRILAMTHQSKELSANATSPNEVVSSGVGGSADQVIKQMERVPLSEFSKDVLEDITEESERNSLSTAEEQQSLSLEKSVSSAKTESKTLHAPELESSTSVVSLNMIQMLEQKVGELQSMLASKDACLAAVNLQLETSHRRESSGANSNELLGSGRDTSSSVTNSTEYRTLQEDFGGSTMDIYMELSKRDELIAKLTDSLQQSLNVRENLQTESEKLSTEVQLLRRQLTEAMDTLRRPYWPRDQESNCGQRISEISMDLISESDDDLERQFLTDNEEKYSRNSRERQLSIPRQVEEADFADWSQTPFSKQIEQFQKYLTPSEVRLFFMVQKKFDDFLSQELEKCKMKGEQELKVALDQMENEKQAKDDEIKRLQTLRQEKDSLHATQMEDLRKYFETKCADLEKQFSDDVFSQKSQRHGADSSSECSDQDQMPEEIMPLSAHLRSKETSPRKRTRAELLLSPSHRQLTPCADAFSEDNKDGNGNISLEIVELKAFYQNKIRELQRLHEDRQRKLNDKVKYYESRYPEDDFMSTTKNNSNTTEATDDDDNDTTTPNTVTQHLRDANTSLIIIDQDELNMNNESQVIQKIIEEYERRLQEQLTLAREDIVHALEQQIQTLLSETTADDQHWPPELVLLREKFTAKSQLQIAQLQIKHEEEMSRLKVDHEKQLNRKSKRHSSFDSARNFEQIISERDALRELSKSFRHVLTELAKCVVNCEDDLNVTIIEEVQRLLASNRTFEDQPQADATDLNWTSTLLNASLNSTKQMRFVPDVHSLLELVEDPSLLQFISSKSGDLTEDFDLNQCLDRLKSEAAYLLQLSEDLGKHQKRRSSVSSGAEKNDSCCEEVEEEDGLKLQAYERAHKFMRTNSLNEQHLATYQSSKTVHSQVLSSLPPDLNRIRPHSTDEFSTPGGNASELNFQVHELKNRLVKSESDRHKLQMELEHNITRNTELGQELQALRDQLSQVNSLNHTDYAEGYGLGSLKSPQRLSGSDKSFSSFAQLQEKARNLLTTPTQQQSNNDATVTLLQMIEDFCREGDKVVECNKKDRDDLQSQIDTADKQLKATRQFLEEQATEREQERDEFLREIERLKAQLRDKEKERSSYANASEEVAQLDSQIRELSQKLLESNAKRDKFEVELKASIDKIFVLREIISELETQVETKALNEHVLGEKATQLEAFINSQSRSNETLQNEVQSLKLEIGESYQERIRVLEEKLQNVRPSAEQSMVLDQVVEQLRDIENTLDEKTKTLESLHHSVSSNSCSISATEDVSVHGSRPSSLPPTFVSSPLPQGSPVHPSPRQHSFTMEGVQRIADKLAKHTRVEEAAIKRIRDLEMQVTQMRNACVELQHERDSLQERMSEQTQRISALQSRLEEQRQRAEELQRAGTSDLNIRIHDLQTEVQNARETLSARDKQIATMKQQLEKSKVAIDRLEAELAVEHQPDRSIVERLESELKQKCAEVQKLKDKIKSEMINKLALPDLMETMLADKNEEIDHLKEQLDSKEKELHSALELNLSQASSGGGAKGGGEVSTKASARTLSDIVSISEFDEPDVVRRAAAQNADTPLLIPEGSGGFLQQTMETSKEAAANLTQKRTEDLSGFAILRPANTFDHPHYFQDPNVLASGKSGATVTPVLVPRQINFSAFTEDSRLKTPNMFEPTPDSKPRSGDKEIVEKLEKEVTELKNQLAALSGEKERIKENNELEIRSMEEDLVATQLRLGGLQEDLEQRMQEITELREENENYAKLQEKVAAKTAQIEQLLDKQEKLTHDSKEQNELLTKNEKNLANYKANEDKYLRRISELEQSILKATECEMGERESLRKELKSLSDNHEQCKHTLRDAEMRKKEIESLNQEIKAKDERLLGLSAKLSLAEENIVELQRQIGSLEREVDKLRLQQQQNSDNSSKQFSVDEIAQQVEKELNYSAQLDSNILRAIESEEENNLDMKHLDKEKNKVKTEPQGTDDENFTGERDLLNQLEALRAQIGVEREQGEEIRQALLAEKQHSQEIQEQDVVIIEAMRKRLETALEKEDDLHKQLDMERERCERVQTQLTALQRAESRRNSSLLLKSPSESPRKSPRSLNEFESELGERLRSEIKLLAAQNERERERSVDLQRSGERERQRYDMELQERVEYCEKLKREMEKLAREKDCAEQDAEHLQERLTLQTQEIESLEARLATLQEGETRRSTRRERQHKESAQLLAEMQELKSKLLAGETERERLTKLVTQLRYDVERSAQREAKLAEALANANTNASDASVPQQFLQKMKEINTLLAENTQENRQMAETVQFLVEERRQLQRKCEELEAQLGGTANVADLEERCNHLLGRYLRVESHRKALVYQKRYLKISLQNYQDKEQRALAAMQGEQMLQPQRNKKKLFKTVALTIIAIQRMKYIKRCWHTGKRIVSKSVFTITQQKRSQPPTISCAAISSTSTAPQPQMYNNHSPFMLMERPLQTPALLSDCAAATAAATATTTFDWPRLHARQQQ